jgi:hypothetical protein
VVRDLEEKRNRMSATNTVRLWLWCLALFVSTIWLHTRHNDFPYYYHPDEPGKVEQVLGRRPLNYHHPMLMLGASKLAAGNSRTEQQVVEAGRRTSAAFTAGAVVALSLLAYAWRGWVMAVATGLTLMLHHQLFELSHYMKEDTALLFGVAVTFLALRLFDHRPGLGRAALVGLGCGLAISGKYAGFIVLAPVLPLLLRKSVPSRGAAVLAMLITMLVTVALINLPLLRDWSAARASLARETQLVVEGQGMTQRVPHSRYWSIFLANTTPVMWLLILLALWGAWQRRSELRAAEWSALWFPFFFAVALSFSPKENDRYFLPATALFTLIAAAGAGEISRLLPTRLRQREKACELAAAVLLVLAQFPGWTEDRGGLLRYWAAFQRDDTAEVTAYLRKNLSPGAVIARDEKVRLPDAKRHSPGSPPLPFKILTEDYAADLSPDGTVEGLAKMGVSHVVITDSTFKKFERQDLKPKEKDAADHERRRNFYITLRRDFSAPVRDWNRSTVIYLHPGIEVYHIGP